MYRKLFFLFPNKSNTETAINELTDAGIDEGHMHAITYEDNKKVVLAHTSSHQQYDTSWFSERVLWYGNLLIFFTAAIGSMATLFWGSWIWSVAALIVAYISFIAADRFSTEVPFETRFDLQKAIKLGKVLLMVEVPKRKVDEIETQMNRKHPEAWDAGVGWSVEPHGV
jgi:hypothetical protein